MNNKNVRKYIMETDGSLMIEIALPGININDITIKSSKDRTITVIGKAPLSTKTSILGSNKKIIIKNIPDIFKIDAFKWSWINGLLVLNFVRDFYSEIFNNDRITTNNGYPFESWMN